MNQPAAILALDVGDKRIGVALASTEVKLANPLTTLENTPKIWGELAQLVEDHGVQMIVVGLPRSLDGNETAQTAKARTFMTELRANLGIPLHAQDEAVTSVKAEEELKSRHKPYEKSDVDALAATYILQDYLEGIRQT